MRQKKAKIILENVRKTYDAIASDFDRTRQTPAHEISIFEPYIKPQSKILDLGCGNGRLLKSLDPKIEYIGMDNSQELLDIAKKNHPAASFKFGDLLNIPLQNGSIDTVICLRTFHHLPTHKMRLAALNEMTRVLKTNGIIIVTVWNLWQKKYIPQLINASLRSLLSLGGYAFNDTYIPWGKKIKRYYHAFTPMELTRLINESGLEIVELTYIKNGKRVPFNQSHDILIIAKKVKFYED